MKNLSFIGRILFALPFGIFGLNHFLMKDVFTGMLTSFIPGAGFTVILTGVALIAACVSIILKKMIRLSCLLLAFLLLLFIATIHIPNLISDNNATFALVNLLKDTSLMGGAMLIAGAYSDKVKSSSIYE